MLLIPSMKRRALALAVLCPLLLTACLPKTIVKTEIVKQYPPAAWLQDCPVPPYIPGQPWEYLATYTASQQNTIACDRCDKARLRAWAADEEPPKDCPTK